MKYYTICLPSNRPLITSKASIESAIAYAGQTGGRLVVSDNSGDVAKKDYFKTVPDYVYFKNADGFSAMDNLLNCIAEVETEFVLPMGDDDFVRASPHAVPFDFANLTPEFSGVKPLTEIFSPAHGIVATSLFTILDETPSERMLNYCRSAPGNNSAYYSFYRKAYVEGLVRLMAGTHPTKGSYMDWAFVLALMSFGKMAEDPATIFTYNAGNWVSQGGIDEGRKTLFRTAGLPEQAENFEALFGFLDCTGFVSSRVSPLSDAGKAEARSAAAVIFMRQFLDQVAREPQTYSDTQFLIDALKKESLAADTSPENMIPHALSIIDAVSPGLAEAYLPFLAETMS